MQEKIVKKKVMVPDEIDEVVYVSEDGVEHKDIEGALLRDENLEMKKHCKIKKMPLLLEDIEVGYFESAEQLRDYYKYLRYHRFYGSASNPSPFNIRDYSKDFPNWFAIHLDTSGDSNDCSAYLLSEDIKEAEGVTTEIDNIRKYIEENV